eukprot:c6340_g1_i1.p1 GENE.c6340_g1_i1~~c6340_g1_i1.p1  ORF type:complete len:184 (+),score=54.93 c6340_g1_i1:34-552(+)
MFKTLVVIAALAFVASAEHPAPGKVIELTNDNFATVLNGELPTIVEFYATWCPHCKSFKSEYENVAATVGGQFIVARLDGEKFSSLADQFQITGYPTVKLLRKGVKGTEASKAEEYEGRMKRASLEQWLKTSTAASGAQSHIQMSHLQPELESIIAHPDRCYRTERSLYVGA